MQAEANTNKQHYLKKNTKSALVVCKFYKYIYIYIYMYHLYLSLIYTYICITYIYHLYIYLSLMFITYLPPAAPDPLWLALLASSWPLLFGNSYTKTAHKQAEASTNKQRIRNHDISSVVWPILAPRRCFLGAKKYLLANFSDVATRDFYKKYKILVDFFQS